MIFIFHQSLIDAESPEIRPRSFGWTAYNNYTEIYNWLDELLLAFPDVLSDFVIGETYEGRPIRGVKISHSEVISDFALEKKLGICFVNLNDTIVTRLRTIQSSSSNQISMLENGLHRQQRLGSSTNF